MYCGLDFIVIAAIEVRISRATAFDPLGYVAATHGEVRLGIGRPERIGSRGWGGWKVGRESQRCSLTPLVEVLVLCEFFFIPEIDTSWLRSLAVLSEGDESRWRLIVLDSAGVSVAFFIFSELGLRQTNHCYLLGFDSLNNFFKPILFHFSQS